MKGKLLLPHGQGLHWWRFPDILLDSILRRFTFPSPDVCIVLALCYCPFCVSLFDSRLFMDEFMGIELDRVGAKKRKWFWNDTETHVHAPPFQPVCFALTPHIAVRVMSQENMTLTFRCKNRSCRLPVGARLKVRVFWRFGILAKLHLSLLIYSWLGQCLKIFPIYNIGPFYRLYRVRLEDFSHVWYFFMRGKVSWKRSFLTLMIKS